MEGLEVELNDDMKKTGNNDAFIDSRNFGIVRRAVSTENAALASGASLIASHLIQGTRPVAPNVANLRWMSSEDKTPVENVSLQPPRGVEPLGRRLTGLVPHQAGGLQKVYHSISIGITFILLAALPASTVHAAVTTGATLTMPNNSLGLVGHWTFDGKDMISNVADTSGQGNNGYLTSFTSTTTVPGVFGQALSLNGSGNYVNGGTGASLNPQTVTVSAWVKGNAFASSYNAVVSKVNGSVGYYQILIKSTGKLALYVKGNIQVSYDGSGIHTLAANKWYHLVLTYDGTSGLYGYVNGVQDKVQAGPDGALANNTGTLSIGTDLDFGGRFFNGTIDDVRIYNRALSAAEVKQLYNQGVGTHQNVTVNPPNLNNGLVGHWTFDGKDMTRNVADTSGLDRTGYLVNYTSTTTASGVSGQALKFDGSTQYVTLVSGSTFLPAGTTKFTISSWVNASDLTTNNNAGIISATFNTEGQYGGFLTGTATNGFACYANISGAWNGVSTAGTQRTNTWYLLTCTYDGSDFRIYLNGLQSNTANFPGTLAYANAGQPTTLGWNEYVDGIAQHFKGSMDDARIYNRVLSPAEVLQLYTQGAGTHQNVTVNPPNLSRGLVGHWTFDGKDMIRNVADTSGQGNTGYLANFTSTTTLSGVLGQALSFKAVSSSDGIAVSIPSSSSLRLSGNGTISLWINPKRSFWPTTYTALIAKRQPPAASAENYEIYMEQATGKVGFYNGTLFTSEFVPPIGEWTHISVTVSGTICNLYIDGSLNTSFSTCGFGTSDTSPLLLGYYHGGAPDYQQFIGSEDDVRIYSRALSAAEVQQLYNLGH